MMEGRDTVGGGVRSEALTLPGFVHDSCAAIFPLSVASPFLGSLPLEKFGLEWLHAPYPLAHPLDNGQAVLAERSLPATARRLAGDGKAYQGLLQPFLQDWPRFAKDLLGPLPLPPGAPLTFGRFAASALWPARRLAQTLFRQPEARALFAGLAAHAMLDLNQLATSAFGIVIALTVHQVGWPLPRRGAQSLSDALTAYFTHLGGEIITGQWVRRLEDLPPARAILFDLTPRQLLQILGERLPPGYRRALQRYRYGMGVFKIDYALDGPVPWQAPECAQAAALHLGGSMEEIASSERLVSRGRIPPNPFVLVAQHTPFDPSRAPVGKHTLWAYCHVPHASPVDMTAAVEAQIERFAPGFRERVLARHVRRPAEMEAYNPNYVGGDINGGIQDLRQLYTRPALRRNPYATPLPGVYLCSSATPPGGGVHGMCGYHAAQAVLRRELRG
jgi:phytoene dehydrogenase-like protein